MFQKSKVLIFSIAILAIAGGCRNDVNIENYPAVSFLNEVQPIIASNCTQSGCHGAVNAKGFALLSYNDVLSRVKPGDGRESDIYKAITGRSDEFMPPSPSVALSDDQIRTIFVWIEQGAPNN